MASVCTPSTLPVCGAVTPTVEGWVFGVVNTQYYVNISNAVRLSLGWATKCSGLYRSNPAPGETGIICGNGSEEPSQSTASLLNYYLFN